MPSPTRTAEHVWVLVIFDGASSRRARAVRRGERRSSTWNNGSATDMREENNNGAVPTPRLTFASASGVAHRAEV
jgi:hypothetical protein